MSLNLQAARQHMEKLMIKSLQTDAFEEELASLQREKSP